MFKKIALMVICLVAVYQISCINSENEKEEFLAFNNDAVYKLDGDESILEEITSLYDDEIIKDQGNTYIMCDTKTIDEIKANYQINIGN